MLELILVLVLAAHLLAANLAGAAPLVCLWLDRREVRRGDALAGKLGRYLLRASLVWLTVGLALGGATLGMVWVTQWERFSATAGRLPAARFWWAVPEVAFYYLCVWGYLRLWTPRDKSSTRRVILRRLLGLLAATNLLYHFPLLFTIIGVYATRLPVDPGPLNFRQAMFDPEVVSQFLHHVLASFAVAGVAMLGFAMRLGRDGQDAADAQRVAAWGGRVALVPTVLQLFVGLYVLLELPQHARDGLLGGDRLGTLLFGLSIATAVMLMHRLASVAFGDGERRDLIATMVLLVLVVVGMVGARQRARQDRIVSAADGGSGQVAASQGPDFLPALRTSQYNSVANTSRMFGDHDERDHCVA